MNFFHSSFFNTLFNAEVPRIILKADPDFIIFKYNEAYKIATGIQNRPVEGMSLWEAFDNDETGPGIGKLLVEALNKASTNKQAVNMPPISYNIPSPDKKGFVAMWWMLEIIPVLEETGECNYLLVTSIKEELTVTNEELHSANEELNISKLELQRSLDLIRESEERFRTLADGSDILISVGDETSKEIYFNEAWTRLTGRPEVQLLDFGWADLIHPDDKDAFLNLYLTAFKKQVPFTKEFRILNKTGNYGWLLATGRPRYNPDGAFAGYINSCIDVTEQKQDDQRKNDFIGMVSHELKTPLTSLSAYMQILLNKAQKNDDEFTRVALEKANSQIGKMNEMINGFLNVSRLESGKIHIDKKDFDLALLAKETEEDLESTNETHNVIFAPVERTMIYADKDKIGHVISNLISNAFKYSAKGSTIHLACITKDKLAYFSVKDEGMGISKDDIPELFDRYYRVKGDHMHGISGFGIGLYLSSEIIKRHDGTIWAESELGKGSTFIFTLPVLDS